MRRGLAEASERVTSVDTGGFSVRDRTGSFQSLSATCYQPAARRSQCIGRRKPNRGVGLSRFGVAEPQEDDMGRGQSGEGHPTDGRGQCGEEAMAGRVATTVAAGIAPQRWTPGTWIVVRQESPRSAGDPSGIPQCSQLRERMPGNGGAWLQSNAPSPWARGGRFRPSVGSSRDLASKVLGARRSDRSEG